MDYSVSHLPPGDITSPSPWRLFAGVFHVSWHFHCIFQYICYISSAIRDMRHADWLATKWMNFVLLVYELVFISSTIIKIPAVGCFLSDYIKENKKIKLLFSSLTFRHFFFLAQHDKRSQCNGLYSRFIFQIFKCGGKAEEERYILRWRVFETNMFFILTGHKKRCRLMFTGVCNDNEPLTLTPDLYPDPICNRIKVKRSI